MQEPIWLREAVVRAVHQRQIREHGGAFGIRDAAALEAALARPHQKFHYDPDADLLALAAAYAYGISSGHPFVDGNKRVSLVACRTFLLLNGQALEAAPAELYSPWMSLAAGALGEDDLAVWLRARVRDR